MPTVDLNRIPEPGANVLALSTRPEPRSDRPPVTGPSAEIVLFEGLTCRNQAARCSVETIITALAADRLEMVYQPQFDLVSGALRGVEALVRLRDERGFELRTAEAIQLAEDHDFIGVLGRRALERAVIDFAVSGLADGSIVLALNVSPGELEDPAYAIWLLSLLDELGLDQQCIEIELTGASGAQVTRQQIAQLVRLRDAGVALALDNFGAGHVNLHQVLAIPVSTVKLHRQFAAAIGSDRRVPPLVRHLASASEELGFRLIAEGIESAAQRDALQAEGCLLGQGFALGRPASIEMVEDSLPDH